MSATFRDITRQAAARRGRASAMRVGASRRSGFALPAAIFLMVILAALGAYIVSINSLQTSSSSLDVLGTRAYQAARAGTEWGAFQVLRGSAVPPAGCFGSTTLTFAGPSLAPFPTTVTCSRSAATDELGTPVTVAALRLHVTVVVK